MIAHAFILWLAATGGLLDALLTPVWRTLVFPLDGALVGAFITAVCYEMRLSRDEKRSLPHEESVMQELASGQ